MARLIVVDSESRGRVEVLVVVTVVLVAIGGVFLLRDSSLYIGVTIIVIAAVLLSLSLLDMLVNRRATRLVNEVLKLLRVEGETLVFSKPLVVKPVEAKVVYRAGGREVPPLIVVSSAGNSLTTSRIDPKSLWSDVKVLSGTSASVGGILGLFGLKQAHSELMVFPALEIVNPEYRVLGTKLYIGILPLVKHEVGFSRETLQVVYGGDTARARLESKGGVLLGEVTYTKVPGGESTGAKLELTFRIRGGNTTYRILLAELSEPGTAKFTWNPGIPETTYLLFTKRAKTLPNVVLTQLGFKKGTLAGGIWNYLSDVKLRLSLNLPVEEEVYDEALITVK